MRTLLVLPTGAGKTVTFSSMVKQAIEKADGRNCLILTDRLELLTQASGTLSLFGIEVEFITSTTKKVDKNKRVFVGMIETVKRRDLSKLLPEIYLTIIDEAHKGNFKRFLDNWSGFIIGATATPISSKSYIMKEHWDDIVVGVDIPDLIDQGYLSPARAYKPDIPLDFKSLKKNSTGEYTDKSLLSLFDKPIVYEGLITNMRLYGDGLKTLVFCVNITHTENTAKQLLKNGYNVQFLHSGVHKNERKRILEWFKEIPDAVLVNCGILTTGFDEPSICRIVLNRATTSQALYLQMCGRGSRLYDGKEEFFILDMGGNIDRFGLWQNSIDWKKVFLKGYSKREGEAPAKMCVSCKTLMHAKLQICPVCGTEQPIKQKEDNIETILKEVSTFKFPPLSLRKRPELLTVKQLIQRAKFGSASTNYSEPYKKGWILHQLKERGFDALKEYADIMGYKSGWVYHQLNKN